MFGDPIQRWLCRDCGHRFSDPKDLKNAREKLERIETIETKAVKSKADKVFTRQICVTETKNLVAEQQSTEVLRGNNEIGNIGNVKGKLVEFELWMQKTGLRASTVRGRLKLMRILTRRGAELYDPESFKDVISKQKWCEGRKANAVDAYSSFLKMVGGKWDPPVYKPVRKIPFVPKETEIDQLISACSDRVATFLQFLKETGARRGEAWMLEKDWIDYETNPVRIAPEKDSNPRIFHVSHKLIGMLRNLPNDYGKYVFSFPEMPLDHFRDNFTQQRKRIAQHIQNPRIQKICFKTMRTWVGTWMYHKTKDILYVMSVLGHKNIKNTLIYIQLEEALFKDEVEYTSKVAKTEKDALVLIEAGFEFVCDFSGHKLFKKRKN
jgi:integrase